MGGRRDKPKNIGAFFDLDHTLLTINASVELAKYFLRHGKIPKRMFAYLFFGGLMYATYLITPEEYISRHIRMIRGEPLEKYKNAANRLFLPNPERFFRKSVVREYYAHKKQGHKVFIVTQTYKPIAEYFSNILKPDKLISTEPEILDGKFTGRGKIRGAHNKYKEVLRMEKKYNLDLSKSYAYTDSIHDIKMLERVGNVYVININPLLRMIAKRRGWKILR